MTASPARPAAARPGRTRRVLPVAVALALAVLTPAAPAPAAATPAPAAAAPAPDPAAPAAPSQGPPAPGSPSVPPEDQASFGIGPATGEAADERPFLAYTVPPLGAVYDSVALVNYSRFPLDLAVYAADAVNGEDGSVGFGDRRSARDAAWVTFGTPEAPVDGLLTVPGRDEAGQPGRVVVPFRVAVPENAPPGDHLVGLVASLTTLGENPGSQNIELEQRVATRVYLRVDGEAVPAMDVLDVAADHSDGGRPWRPGTVDVSWTLANAGNLRAGVVPAVVVSGPFGLGERRVELDPVVDLLPGSSQRVQAEVPGVWPLGRMDVTAVNEVVAPPNGEDPGLGTTRQTVGLWAVTPGQLVVLAVLALLAGVLVARRVRRVHGRRTVTQVSQPAPAAVRETVA